MRPGERPARLCTSYTLTKSPVYSRDLRKCIAAIERFSPQSRTGTFTTSAPVPWRLDLDALGEHYAHPARGAREMIRGSRNHRRRLVVLGRFRCVEMNELGDTLGLFRVSFRV
jgi:hypothetical protein